MRLPLVALTTLALVLGSASSARARPQISARLGAGGGVRSIGGAGLFELHLRSELLLGADAARAVRAGPALELRTCAFDTLEAVGGGAVMLPILGGAPLVLIAGAGYAARSQPAPSGAVAVGTLAWGFRPYNHHADYGFALQVYASARVGLEAGAPVELTAGVEVDLLFLVAIPAIFVWELLTGGDPDEPE